jgi:hypothetical protein
MPANFVTSCALAIPKNFSHRQTSNENLQRFSPDRILRSFLPALLLRPSPLIAYEIFPIARIGPLLFNASSEEESLALYSNLDTARQHNTLMITILVVVVLLIALGALPTWPYSRGWGYYPSSGLGLVVLVLVVLLLLGRI